MRTRQIEAFRAVMLSGGITRAAELMNVTQPAVTRLIRDLQETTRLELFVRRGARLLPTSEALSLYHEVERSYVGIDRIAQAAEDLRAHRAGTLRIAAMPALANGFLPRFVGRFLAGRPKLDLALHGLGSPLVLDWVAAGQCDLGFAANPIEHPTVTAEPLGPVATVAVVPAGHRHARRRFLTPAHLANETFVSLGQSTLIRHRIDAAFAEAGVPRQLRVETPLSEISCALVSSGIGVSIVEPFTAAEFAGRGVVAKTFRPRIDFDFSALYSTQRPLSGIARAFLTAFKAHITEFMRHWPHR
jgi:DNA-binding transcriptional LysR family regulator